MIPPDCGRKSIYLFNVFTSLFFWCVRFCARQGWGHPQLLLILPPPPHQTEKLSVGLSQKQRLSGREHVVLPSTTHLSAAVVLAWLSEQILSRVPAIHDLNTLEEVWLNVTDVSQKKVGCNISLFNIIWMQRCFFSHN